MTATAAEDDLPSTLKPTSTSRLRWASQRHPHGRPKRNTALSMLRRLSRAGGDSSRTPTGEADIAQTGTNFGGNMSGEETPKKDEEETKREKRRIYFNMRLPQEETHDDGTPLHYYPRNKIRTAKYTPLTFIPKNLYFQLHNVANIYFLFIVVLQVRNAVCASTDTRYSLSSEHPILDSELYP